MQRLGGHEASAVRRMSPAPNEIQLCWAAQSLTSSCSPASYPISVLVVIRGFIRALLNHCPRRPATRSARMRRRPARAPERTEEAILGVLRAVAPHSCSPRESLDRLLRTRGSPSSPTPSLSSAGEVKLFPCLDGEGP